MSRTLAPHVCLNPPYFGPSRVPEPPVLWPLLRSKYPINWPILNDVRDDELRRALTESNPWWRAAVSGADPVAWVASHRLLRDRSKYDLGYRSRILDDIGKGPVTDELVVLTGPRRVGKSVVLLETAATLCNRSDLDPRQVIHLPCDGMTARDLRRALTLGRELTRTVDTTELRPRVWLMDEVSSIAGWTAIIKNARDGTPLGEDTVVLTGSRWQEKEDLLGNLMTGRAGSSPLQRSRHLHPMSFRSFLEAARPELSLLPKIHPAELQDQKVANALDEIRFDVDAYDLAWQAYMTCGGFPRAVFEYARGGIVSDGYLRDLAAWLRADVAPDQPPDSIPRLLSTLSARATSPLSVRSAAEEAGYGRKPMELRITRLVSTFAAHWCHQRNEAGDAIFGAQSKLYLTDPILSWLPSRLRAGLPSPDMTSLSEMALGIALARAIDDLDEDRWSSADTIGYARTESGQEVDLTRVPVPSSSVTLMTVPIESKWVDQGWREEARVIEGKFGCGILATKSILDLDHPSWAVPAPLVALLLE